MTGYGRGQSAFNGTKFAVELNSVNRKQSDVTCRTCRVNSRNWSRVCAT